MANDVSHFSGYEGVKSDLFRFSGDVSVIPFNLTNLKMRPFSSYGQHY